MRFYISTTSRIIIFFAFYFYSSVSTAQDCKIIDDKTSHLITSELSDSLTVIMLKELLIDFNHEDCSAQAATAYRLIGLSQMELNINDQAILSFKKSLEFALQSTRPRLIGASLSVIGQHYDYEEQYDSSLHYFNSALKQYLIAKDPEDLILIYQNLAATHYNRGENEMAERYYKKLIKLTSDYGSQIDISTAEQIRILLESEKKGVSDSSFYNLRQCLIAFKELGDVESEMNIYESIGHNFESIQNYDSAIYYYQQASSLANDSLKSVYHVGWMNDKITDLTLIVQEKNKNKALWIWGLLILLGIISLLSYVLIRNKQHKEQIKDQEIKELLKEQELAAVEAMLEGQEKERKRIAEELHDRLGGLLAALKLNYSAIEEQVDRLQDKAKNQYNKAGDLIDETAKEVRRISHNLYSGVLIEFGLVAALEQLDETLQTVKEPKFEWHYNNMGQRMESELEINLYRIVQEGIGNILKHAKAKEVTVQLTRNNGELNLMLEDNGVGFDFEKMKKSKGIGLKNIESRVERLHGKINFDSAPGRGTIMIVDIPINV